MVSVFHEWARAVSSAVRSAVVRTVGSVRRSISGPIDRRVRPQRPISVVTLDGQSPDEIEFEGRSLFIGQRRRLATASDIAWLGDDRLVVVYLLTSTIATFAFSDDVDGPRLRPLEIVRSRPGLEQPAGLAVSPDGSWLAMTNTAEGCISVVSSLDVQGVATGPVTSSVPVPGDRNLHGIAVSPDTRWIAFTSVDKPGGLRVAQVVGDPRGGACLSIGSIVENEHQPLVPKGVGFTPDGRFLVVAYGCNAGGVRLRVPKGFVEVRQFDSESGGIGGVVSRSGESLPLVVGETVTVLPDGSAVVVVDQVAERVLLIDLDPVDGRLGKVTDRIGWSAGGLSFPHGSAVSPDQSLLAITNYGDGSIRFFELTGRVTDPVTSRTRSHSR